MENMLSQTLLQILTDTIKRIWLVLLENSERNESICHAFFNNQNIFISFIYCFSQSQAMNCYKSADADHKDLAESEQNYLGHCLIQC